MSSEKNQTDRQTDRQTHKLTGSTCRESWKMRMCLEDELDMVLRIVITCIAYNFGGITLLKTGPLGVNERCCQGNLAAGERGWL